MDKVSVFDIAEAIIRRTESGALPTLTLQKLCFYVYGWYAHLTGESLFSEAFYAMEKGPVVGELLSAHAGRSSLSSKELADQFNERGVQPQELSPFVGRVVDAVWQQYGHLGRFKLVDMTHDEDVWTSAWESRPTGSKRGDISPDDLVAYFQDKSRPSEEVLQLPLSIASKISPTDLEGISVPLSGQTPLVGALRRLRLVA